MSAPTRHSDDMVLFARAVISAAAETESAETRIKEAVLAAARAGNNARVIEIVTRWQSMPAAKVLD